MAAAIGGRTSPINEPRGHMIVDYVGGGTTEVAVVSLGDMVRLQVALDVAGDDWMRPYIQISGGSTILLIPVENVRGRDENQDWIGFSPLP